MGIVVQFTAVPKNPAEERVELMRRTVLRLHQARGFVHPKQVPTLRYIPEDARRDTFAPEAWYDHAHQTIYVDNTAIRGFSVPTPQALANNPSLGRLFLPGNEALGRKTTDIEVLGLLSSLFAEHLLLVKLEECPRSWMHNATEPCEVLARQLIMSGICEYFYKMAHPGTEVLRDTIWDVYDEGPVLSKQCSTRDWIESSGGYLIAQPILDAYAMRGLEYLLSVPLIIDRHFSLREVRPYRDNALEYLKTNTNS